MDIVKQEMAKKRETLAKDAGGRKFFKRSEIEQKRIQRIREEEQREAQAKALKHHSSNPNSNPNHNNSSSSNPNSATTTDKSNPESVPSSSKTPTDEQKIDDLNLPKPEVIRRLRLLRQPVTLFGEDDDARLNRLKYVLKAGLFEIDDDMTEGQTNDFLRDIVELKKRQKSGIVDRKRKPKEDKSEDNDGGGGDDDMSGDGNESDVDYEKDLKRMKSNFEELCDEDRILVFFKRLLNEWKQELDEMGDAGKRTAKGKANVAKFKQCARYLHPLFKFCRKKVEYYGTPVSLKSIAQISTPDSSSLLVSPYDKSSLKAIEKAIVNSDVALTPNNDGDVIRLSIPQLTADRRKELTKLVAKQSEEGKVALRNIRRDAIKAYEKLEKEKKLSEDNVKDLSSDLQKVTDEYIKKIESILKQKEKELLTV